MIKLLVNWTLYTLKVKNRPKQLSGRDALIGLIPFMVGACIVLKVIESMGPYHTPWYRRIWYWIKVHIRRTRAIVIGY